MSWMMVMMVMIVVIHGGVIVSQTYLGYKFVGEPDLFICNRH